MADEMKKKSGRPPLSPDEREARRKAKVQRDNNRQKERGYPAHKKYVEKHRGEIYEARLRLPADNRHLLEELLSNTNLSVTQLFTGALKEKYGVDLMEKK
nr:MAG TPA: hypothetical protein [Caudoviricetes sp.]